MILYFPRNLLATKWLKVYRNQYKDALKQIFFSANDFGFLIVLLSLVLYSFAGVGQQIFGGLIVKSSSASSSAISQSYYGINGYWPLNFNDMPSGIVSMFVLLHVNNMHVTTSGFVAATSQWAELFFALFYTIGVLLLLNILTAFFLTNVTTYLKKLVRNKGLQVLQERIAVGEELLITQNVLLQLANSEGFSENRAITENLNNVRKARFSTSLFANEASREQLDKILVSSYSNNHTDHPMNSLLERGSATSLRTSLISDAFSFKTKAVDHEGGSGHFSVSSRDSTSRSVSIRRKSMITFLLQTDEIKPYEKAAVLLHFAREGEEHSMFETLKQLQYFRLRSKIVNVLRFSAWSLNIVRIFERPQWSYKNPNWNNNAIYPRFDLSPIYPLSSFIFLINYILYFLCAFF